MAWFNVCTKNLLTQNLFLHDTSENTFSHRDGITITTVEKISKIQEGLKVIPQVWPGHHCEVDYLNYDHVQKKV
jgi:hypothetical protein